MGRNKFYRLTPGDSCEACEKYDNQWVLQDNYDVSIKYKLCANCLYRLTSFSLTPKLFFNLLKNGHNVREHVLHGDFYDKETGKALQPMR